MNICIAASAGGHFTQLLAISEAWSGRKHFFITTNAVVAKKFEQEAPVYVVKNADRRSPAGVFRMLMRCISIFYRERPTVILSSGAAVGCIMSVLGKLHGAKIIWIDSIANIDRLSLSGRIVRPLADVFLVQWPDLAEKNKGTTYIGSVI
jgi:UDP-N-acetylglucosamine:LPS N-acetylglucosamine transferase